MAEINIAYAGSQKKQQEFFENLEQAASEWHATSSNTSGVGLKLNVFPLFKKSSKGIELVHHGRQIHAVVHKLTEDMAHCLQTDSESAECSEQSLARVQALSATLARVPVVLDGLRGVWRILDRIQMARAIDQAVTHIAEKYDSTSVPRVQAPAWISLSLRDGTNNQSASLRTPLTFPVILKRRLACGTDGSHQMVIAYDRDGVVKALREVFQADDQASQQIGNIFKEISSTAPGEERTNDNSNKKYSADIIEEQLDHAHDLKVESNRLKRGKGLVEFDDVGIVVQEFISEHGGVLFKVYAIGDRFEVQTRSSVQHSPRNCKQGYFYFDSQRDGCKDSISLAFDPRTGQSKQTRAVKPSEHVVKRILKCLGAELQLSLIGVDVLYDVDRNCFVIVDVNYLPGYRGATQAHKWLLDHIVKRVRDSGAVNVAGNG